MEMGCLWGKVIQLSFYGSNELLLFSFLLDGERNWSSLPPKTSVTEL